MLSYFCEIIFNVPTLKCLSHTYTQSLSIFDLNVESNTLFLVTLLIQFFCDSIYFRDGTFYRRCFYILLSSGHTTCNNTAVFARHVHVKWKVVSQNWWVLLRQSYTEWFVWYDLYDSYSVSKSKELLHCTICMIWFNDSNISS